MKYFICEICGNLVELINEGGGELVCCGEAMTEIKARTTDEGTEKHLPIVQKNDSEVIVKIGSVEHPMTEEHHIEWISIHYNNKTQRIKLNPISKAEVTFKINGDIEKMEVYSYCNIHGLWKTEF